jgi:low molecular weight phosphotyrosine protein phosphatase
MAEAVFRHATAANPAIGNVDSAGTASYHAGSSPDTRTLSTLAAHGIGSYMHSARQVRETDFETFDWLFGMDAENVTRLERMRARVVKRRGGEDGVGRVGLFGGEEEVLDPYYGEGKGFETAYHQMVKFTKSFLETLPWAIDDEAGYHKVSSSVWREADINGIRAGQYAGYSFIVLQHLSQMKGWTPQLIFNDEGSASYPEDGCHLGYLYNTEQIYCCGRCFSIPLNFYNPV